MTCPFCRKRFPSLKTAHYCRPVGERVIKWFPKQLVHTKDRFAGQPFVLAKHQARDVIGPIFGTLVFDEELQAWFRQIRTAYLEFPRKEGKSELGAGIGVRMTFAEGEWGGETYSVAKDKDQAKRTFAVGKTMVESNPALERRARIYKDTIEAKKTGNIWQVIPGDEGSAEGKNPSCVLFDELHTQRKRELFAAMTTAQGARSQPLTVMFSTAGVDKNSICWEQHDYGEKVKRGILVDPTFLYVRYGIEQGEDWEDEKVWRRSMPSIGEFKRIGPLRDEYAKAKELPRRRAEFRRYYLNDWDTKSAATWMDVDRWDSCRRFFEETELEGCIAYGAVDASASMDVASVCWYFPDEEMPTALFRFFVPSERVAELDNHTGHNFSQWIEQGAVTVLDGKLLDDEKILAALEADIARFDVQEIGFKPGGVTAPIVRKLDEQDVKAFHASRTTRALSPATNEFERLVMTEDYRHAGNPLMRYQIDGVVLRKDSDGNIKPDPEKSLVNIAGPMTAVLALDGAMRDVDEADEPGELVSFT